MFIQILSQILAHTPLYVWAILAFLLYRGAIALRDRELEPRKLAIIPAVMLALSLQDIVAKFGSGGMALSLWAAAACAMAALVWTFGGVRVAAGSAPGRVRVRGSWGPMALMMAVFFIKYLASVMLAVRPHLRDDAVFVAAVCVLFGLFSGVFAGRLARDLRACQDLQAGAAAARLV